MSTHDAFNVLLVDDDPMILRFLTKVLEAQGYSVLATTSGNKAAHLLGTHRVGLLITDIFMPDTDGFALIREFRSRNAGKPILTMTGGITNGIYADEDMLIKTARRRLES
jgi:DNA-binding response OmpR family regulator